ncbi:MAG: metal ABC transporter ATP-binding protein [Thermomicrobiales bacterium]|nr:metal ABC transporter ATP-binding protein [Thermomicrobiales bacterium]
MSAGSLVDLSGICASYDDREALDHVSLALNAGEVVSFVGPNGAGKSTLLKVIAGHVRPDRGTVSFSAELGSRPRQEINYVPQRDKLDWSLPASVLDLVLMGAYRQTSRWRPLRHESTDDALRALDVVGMRHHAGTQIGRLSGGQQQRVILARALIRPAAIYLLDEPFTGVDAPTEALFEQVIHSLREEGKCVVMATHNLDCARDVSDRVLVLNRRTIALGPPVEALTPVMIAVAFGDISHLHIHGEDAHVHV